MADYDPWKDGEVVKPGVEPGLLNWLYNVFTGTFLHWNKNCNKYVASLHTSSVALSPPLNHLVINSINAAYNVVESLVGPDQGSERILRIDPKQINSSQYRAMINMFIWVFVGRIASVYRETAERLYQTTSKLIDISDSEKELFDSVCEWETATSSADDRTTDAEAVVRKLSDELIRLLGIGEKGSKADSMVWKNVTLVVALLALLNTAQKQMFDQIEIDVLGSAQ